MKTILMLSLVLGAVQEEQKTRFPMKKGAQWKYQVTPGIPLGKPIETTWRIGEEKEIQIIGKDNKRETVKGHILEGFGTESYLVEIEDGIEIVTTRHVGYAGTPALVVAADLRWGAVKSWKFRTLDGCCVDTVECSQEGTESVSVPNGAYECLKIRVGRETFWMDVKTNHGIVRRSIAREGKGRSEDVWELTSYSPVFDPPLTPDK